MRILVLHFLTLIGTTCHKDDSKLNRTKYNSHKLYEQNWLYIWILNIKYEQKRKNKLAVTSEISNMHQTYDAKFSG